MKRLSAVLFVALYTLTNCDDDPKPVEIIVNGNLEAGSSIPINWLASDGNHKYQAAWTSLQSYSPSRSLSISTQTGDAADFAYWTQRICQGLPAEKGVFLNVKVKGNLVGQGISLALRADPPLGGGSPLKFVTTQGKKSITGTFDWTTYDVEMDAIPTGTECLYIFLVFLPNTTGEVYFDDASLVHY